MAAGSLVRLLACFAASSLTARAQNQTVASQPTETECPTAGQECQTTDKSFPAIRGLCVVNPSGSPALVCWDVCDTSHDPNSYVVTTGSQGSSSSASGYTLMVQQVRSGQHTAVSCPNSTSLGTCEPGSRCTRGGLARDQGMCVFQSGRGNVCLDMCDRTIPIENFESTPGHREGTRATVEKVRNMNDDGPYPVQCPGRAWLWILLVAMLCIFCVLCCACGFFLYDIYKNRFARKRSAAQREPEWQPQQYEEAPLVEEPRYEPVPVEETAREVVPEPVPMEQPRTIIMPQPVAPAVVPMAATSYSMAAQPMTASVYSTGRPMATVPPYGMSSMRVA